MKTKTINYSRNKKGEFKRETRIKRIGRWIFTRIIIPTDIAGVAFAGIVINNKFNHPINYRAEVVETVTVADKPIEKTISLEDFNALVKKEQDAILDKLMHAESDNYEALGFDSRDALTTFDPDSSGKVARIPSYGCLQYKDGTMQQFYEEIHGKKLTQLEARNISQNCEQAKEVTRYVVFVKHVGGEPIGWANSFRKLGLQAKVDELQEKIDWFNSIPTK